MTINFRNYCKEPGITEDYYKVREFLLKLNNVNFPFGRWDWMITHGYLDKSGLGKIGIWENKEEIVALATYDTGLGGAFICVYPEYTFLKEEMLLYSEKNLDKDGSFAVLIDDTDSYFQEIAAKNGYYATQAKDCDAIYPIHLDKISYHLPEGYHITSMNDNYDLYKYGQVLWKGFNHEKNGEGVFTCDEDKYKDFESEMKRPNVNLDLKIAVVAPNGDFVSYCGMWFDPASDRALVEPVATDPDYRMLGLGKAAVLEGIKRCGILGAKQAFVGSSQQFYYNIGFRPYATYTFWKRK
ncbi:MAG: hypothetical protein K0S47_2292 [Herbinix sp.]|jgi:GNAT superfamily N-acetyltransferase|nr:hypothetical protein [Herbinix sp.]